MRGHSEFMQGVWGPVRLLQRRAFCRLYAPFYMDMKMIDSYVLCDMFACCMPYAVLKTWHIYCLVATNFPSADISEI